MEYEEEEMKASERAARDAERLAAAARAPVVQAGPVRVEAPQPEVPKPPPEPVASTKPKEQEKKEEVVEDEVQVEEPEGPPEEEDCYFRPHMDAKAFFEHQVDKSNAFREEFEIKRPKHLENLKALCELCQIEEEGFCCPEHCCDWDECRCKTCVQCKARRNQQRKAKHETETALKEKKINEEDLHKYVYNVAHDPGVKLVTEKGQEEVQVIRRKKKLDFGDKEEKKEEVPQEVIRCADELVIQNYDVDFEEEGPDLRMLGGVRGIRALKVQREYLKDVEPGTTPPKEEPTHNRFARYEKKS